MNQLIKTRNDDDINATILPSHDNFIMKSTKFSVTIVDKKEHARPISSELFNDSVSSLGSIGSFNHQSMDEGHAVDVDAKEYLTAPYFERIPLFADPVENDIVPERKGLSSASSPRRPVNNKFTPKRPSSSRPNSSRGTLVASPKQIKLQSNTLESRILMKIASFMPDDEGAEKENTMYNRLSSSRTDLIHLNTILDEMTTEIRENETLQGPAVFNNHGVFNDIPEPTMAHVENFAFRNGEIMYDTILSDLIVQAIKKINRVRKFYKNRFKQLEDASKLKFHSVEIRVEELTSSLHRAEAERLLYLKTTKEVHTLTHAQQTVGGGGGVGLCKASTAAPIAGKSINSDAKMTSTISSDDPASSTDRYAALVQSAMGRHEGGPGSDELAESSKHAQMAKSLAGLLQTERKESLTRMKLLSTELVTTQSSLETATRTIVELRTQLLDRDRQLLELSRRTVQLAVSQISPALLPSGDTTNSATNGPLIAETS